MNLLPSLCLLLSLINTPKQSTKISLTPSFSENQTKDYRIIYSVKANSEGIEQIISTTKKMVSLKVISIHNDLIDMQWKYGNIEFVEDDYQSNPFAILMNTLCAGITVKYSMDKKGAIKSILNREEISTSIQKNIDKKLTSLANDGSVSSSMITATKFQFQMMFSTPDQVDKIILGDLFKFHQLYGKEYSSQPTEIVVNQELLPEKYEVSLHSIDQANHSCLIRSKLIEDPSKEIIKDYRYNLTDYWLLEHSSKMITRTPSTVIQYYQIQLLP